jgi:hypothetical protein
MHANRGKHGHRADDHWRIWRPGDRKITNVAQKVHGADAIELGERAKEGQMIGTNETMYVETQVAG